MIGMNKQTSELTKNKGIVGEKRVDSSCAQSLGWVRRMQGREIELNCVRATVTSSNHRAVPSVHDSLVAPQNGQDEQSLCLCACGNL